MSFLAGERSPLTQFFSAGLSVGHVIFDADCHTIFFPLRTEDKTSEHHISPMIQTSNVKPQVFSILLVPCDLMRLC